MWIRWLIVAVLAIASPARADDAVAAPFEAPVPVSKEPAVTAMKTYFRGEILGGFTLIGMGAVGLGLGTTLHVTADGREGVKSASYPLFVMGAAHLLAGVFVDLSSVKRIRTFGTDIERDPESWIRREEKRIRGVEKQFLVLEIVEGVGIAAGIGLAAYGRETDRPGLTGLGIAIAGEMAATLIFDIVAARRAKRYRSALGGISF